MKIRLGFISDTHTLHEKWFDNLQYGHWGYEYEQQWKDLDILIFAGDCSSMGYFQEIKSFTKWFSEQPAKHKVMIAGNHDFGFETIANFDWESPSNKRPPYLEDLIPENVTYLNDEGIEIMGLKIWGSPITPWFHSWAFNRTRSNGQEGAVNGIKKHWDMIPNDTDILITHGPPKGYLDLLSPKFRRNGEDPHIGCFDLLEAIARVRPKINVFGHIHEGYGTFETTETKFINASCLNDSYKPTNPPIIITLDI